MKKDATFKWDNKEFVDFYTQSANVIMLERQRCIKVLLEIVKFHFQDITGLHILDLGCGDGIISKYIYNKSPDNEFYLIDASEEMYVTNCHKGISYQHSQPEIIHFLPGFSPAFCVNGGFISNGADDFSWGVVHGIDTGSFYPVWPICQRSTKTYL